MLCELPEHVDVVLIEQKLVVVMFLGFEHIELRLLLLPPLKRVTGGCNGSGRRWLERELLLVQLLVLDVEQ